MNYEDLTLKELKEISSLFNSNENLKENILSSSIGKYVIVRTRNEGINSGKVLEADETGCVIEDARRIYYHKPKDNNVSWYEGVAETGLHSDSKISCPVSKKYIVENYSLTICSKIAEKSIRNHESTKS